MSTIWKLNHPFTKLAWELCPHCEIRLCKLILHWKFRAKLKFPFRIFWTVIFFDLFLLFWNYSYFSTWKAVIKAKFDFSFLRKGRNLLYWSWIGMIFLSLLGKKKMFREHFCSTEMIFKSMRYTGIYIIYIYVYICSMNALHIYYIYTLYIYVVYVYMDLGRFTPRTFHPRMVHPRTFHPRMIHPPESSPPGYSSPPG